MSDYRLRIGGRIRRARKRHGWSQHELARRTGIPKLTGSQVSRWERGVAMPNSEHLNALEQTLGIVLIPDGEDEEPASTLAAWSALSSSCSA